MALKIEARDVSVYFGNAQILHNVKKARASTKERTLTIPMSIVRRMYSMCHRRHAGIIFKVEPSCRRSAKI